MADNEAIEKARKVAHAATATNEIIPSKSPYHMINDAIDALSAAGLLAGGIEVLTEHASLMNGGGMHVRPRDPRIERIFPLEEWIDSRQRNGGKVYRRRVVVIEDWAEAPSSSLPSTETPNGE